MILFLRRTLLRPVILLSTSVQSRCCFAQLVLRELYAKKIPSKT